MNRNCFIIGCVAAIVLTSVLIVGLNKENIIKEDWEDCCYDY